MAKEGAQGRTWVVFAAEAVAGVVEICFPDAGYFSDRPFIDSYDVFVTLLHFFFVPYFFDPITL
jgi:hypothetical protein